jgi:hypothetical protein
MRGRPANTARKVAAAEKSVADAHRRIDRLQRSTAKATDVTTPAGSGDLDEDPAFWLLAARAL